MADSKSASDKFLAECGDLKEYISNVDQKVSLLDIEVGALLRKQDFSHDGPSDASLKILQEARTLRKSLDSSIRDSSEITKKMDYILRDLLDKVKTCYQQTQAMEEYMEKYGYEIPPPIDSTLFDIFRDSVIKPEDEGAKAGEEISSGSVDEATNESDVSKNSCTSDSSPAQRRGQDHPSEESENEILDKTDSDAQFTEEEDLDGTEMQFKNSKGKMSDRERYAFQTSVLTTPAQNINFSKKAINFHNSYLFQSPVAPVPNKDLLVGAASVQKAPNIITSASPHNSSPLGILKSISKYDMEPLHSSSSTSESDSSWQAFSKQPSTIRGVQKNGACYQEENPAKNLATTVPANLHASVTKPRPKSESSDETLKASEVLSNLQLNIVMESAKKKVSTPVKSNYPDIDEMETPEAVRAYLKDLDTMVRTQAAAGSSKDKENVTTNTTSIMGIKERLSMAPQPTNLRQSMAPSFSKEMDTRRTEIMRPRESLMPSDATGNVLAILAEKNREISAKNRQSVMPSKVVESEEESLLGAKYKFQEKEVIESVAKPSLPRPSQFSSVPQPETPEHVREFIRNLGK